MAAGKKSNIGRKTLAAKANARRRAAETPEQRLNRLEKCRRLAAIKLQNETPEQRATRLLKCRKNNASNRKRLRVIDSQGIKNRSRTVSRNNKSKQGNVSQIENDSSAVTFRVDHKHQYGNNVAHNLSQRSDTLPRNTSSYCPKLDFDVLKQYVKKSVDRSNQSSAGELDSNGECLAHIEIDVDVPQPAVYFLPECCSAPKRSNLPSHLGEGLQDTQHGRNRPC